MNSTEYDMGFDCGMNGANKINCHFSLFATREQTKRWEHGRDVALKTKAARAKQKETAR